MNQYLHNIVLLGAPGSGKGTQAQLLKEKFQLIHASTGDMFRKEIEARSPLGLKAKNIMDKGALCPDELTLDMLCTFINSFKNAKGFLLDGVPRTIKQTLMMEGVGYPYTIPVSLAVFIQIDEREAIERLLHRGQLQNRTDDTLNVIRQRIVHYEIQTKPLIEHYSTLNKLITVNGMQVVEKVFTDICTLIERTEDCIHT